MLVGTRPPVSVFLTPTLRRRLVCPSSSSYGVHEGPYDYHLNRKISVKTPYLAREGRKVLVLEKRATLGGAACTEEIYPGFKYSRFASVCNVLRPLVVKELELLRHGLEMFPRSPGTFTPTLDGKTLTLHRDVHLDVPEIAKFSRHDADRYPDYVHTLQRVSMFLESVVDETPPDFASVRLEDKLSGVFSFGRIATRLLRLGKNLPNFVQLLSFSATRFLDRWFESEPLRATLATDTIMGYAVNPNTRGTANALLHNMSGKAADWMGSYVKGGMGTLSEAIARSAREAGAEIRVNSPVKSILLNFRRHAVGVRLQDGTEIRAQQVISNLDPKTTFLKLLPQDALEPPFRERIESYDATGALTKINCAVDRLPNFKAAPTSATGDPGPQHTGSVLLVDNMKTLEEACIDAESGKASTRPVVTMMIPSAVDPTLAPPRKHVVQLLCQFTPYHLTGEMKWTTPGVKEAFSDRVFETIEMYCPGFTESVLHRDILTPTELEDIIGLPGGHIFHGAMNLEQLFFLRPVEGASNYKTPVKNLLLCGAGSHPGGRVTGAAGRNAAMVALPLHGSWWGPG